MVGPYKHRYIPRSFVVPSAEASSYRCRQMRLGKADAGTTYSEKCRQRIETEMRRESDPRIKRAEDKHTEFEAVREIGAVIF